MLLYTLQVTPSNAFDIYPVIVTQISGTGFRFTMAARFSGLMWCSVVREIGFGEPSMKLQDVKAGVGAGTCFLAEIPLIGGSTLQEIEIVNCGLVQLVRYSGISRMRFIHYSNQIPCSSNMLLCCF